MKTKRTPLPSPWDNSAVKLVDLQEPPRKEWRHGETVVLADGQRCVKIPLSMGMFTIINIEDSDSTCCFKWRLIGDSKRGFYAYRWGSEEGRRKYIPLHGFINASRGMTDHKNRNSLDNRRLNLRECTNGQNQFNTAARFGRKFKGVFKSKSGWRAAIRAGKLGQVYLGRFKSEESAARAYDEKAKQLHGDFCHLNFPTGKEREVMTQ